MTRVIVCLGLYLYVFSIPFKMPGRLPLEIATITGAIFLLTTLLHLRVCYRMPPHALWWFMGYLYVFALSCLFRGGAYPETTIKLIAQFVQLLLVFWTSSNLFRYERIARVAILVLVVACTIRAGMQLGGIAVSVSDSAAEVQRVSALGQNKNFSAWILSAGILGAVGLSHVWRGGWRFRLGALALASVLGLALVQTGSRGGLLSLSAGLGGFVLASARARIGAIAVGSIAAAFLVGASYSSDVMRTRFENTLLRGDLGGREAIFPILGRMFIERPFLGWGPVANKYELATRLLDPEHSKRDSHNLILEVITTTGVVGAVPFFVGVALCGLRSWIARRGSQGALPFAMLVAVLAANMSGNGMYSNLMWLVFAYAVGSAYGVSRRRMRPVFGAWKGSAMWPRGTGGISTSPA